MRVINGNYEFEVLPDGTKRRWVENPTVIPEPVLPEQMDLKITDWCDANCAWCHEGSTERGEHGDLSGALDLLRECLPSTEIAIGGGDPLSHPDFEPFVRELDARGLIPNVTVNGRHLERHLPMLQQLTGEGVLRGVGISLHKHIPEWEYQHKVLHVIAGVNDPKKLLEAPPQHLLILGYKTHGRGQEYQSERVRSGIREFTRYLPLLAEKHILSFDTLAISQVYPQRLFSDPRQYAKRFMGEEGQYSMYVDAVTQTYAVSSYAKRRLPWHGLSGMFQNVRAGLV